MVDHGSNLVLGGRRALCDQATPRARETNSRAGEHVDINILLATSPGSLDSARGVGIGNIVALESSDNLPE